MIPLSLSGTPFRFLPLLLSACAAALGLSSCAVLEPGAPSAAITVTADSRFDVLASVERVFREEGWRVSRRDLDALTLERTAGKADTVLHGNWIDGEISERVRVVVTENGEGRFRVRCLPSVVRDPNDVAFEDDHRRMQLFSFHFSSLLREVKRDLQ